MRRRISAETYRRITLFALLALIAIVVTGGAVRLTGSGLGCSDWPNCEQDQFVADFEYHAMVEFVNRLITGLVSVAVILAVLGSMWRSPRRRDLTAWSWGLVAGVVGQIVLGGLVVLFELKPWLVVAHFLLSMVLVWNATVLVHLAWLPDDRVGTIALRAPAVTRLAWVQTAAGAVVLFTGTIVTGSGPHGGDEEVERFPFEIPDVARIHGISVVGLALVVVATILVLQRYDVETRLQRHAQILLLVLLAQAAVGYSQYLTDVPVLLVGIHILGATLLWSVLIGYHMEVLRPLVDPDAPDSRPVRSSVAAQTS
jgi:cytochrome c oxidase assembly protein subunit 15